MNKSDFIQLSRFQSYAQKRFDLPLLAGCFADSPAPAGHSLPRRRVEFGPG